MFPVVGDSPQRCRCWGVCADLSTAQPGRLLLHPAFYTERRSGTFMSTWGMFLVIKYSRPQSKAYLFIALSTRLTARDSVALPLSVCDFDCFRLHPGCGLQHNGHEGEYKPALLESQQHPGGWLLPWLQTHPGRIWVGADLGASLKASKSYSLHLNVLWPLLLMDSATGPFISVLGFVF